MKRLLKYVMRKGRHMKKYVYSTLVVLLAVTLFIMFSNRAERDMTFEEEIIALMAQGQKEIDLRKLSTDDWTRAALFPPYTTNEVIEETMDIQFSGDNGQIDLLDCCFLLVLATDEEAVKTAMLPMHYGIEEIREHRVLILKE